MTQSALTARPAVSFEFFPPKTPAAAANLWASVERLAPLGPQFVSVTYGAGGTTRERTVAAIMAIRDRAGLDVAGHLTCVGATREETLAVAETYAKAGCTRIVALRGDPPKGEGRFTPHPGGFESATELVAGLAAAGWKRIAVGAYPETHPEAASPQADIDNLKRKLDAGATEAITQFFFENATFLRFRDACARAGITAPIIPGILPIENFAKMRRFAEGCGAGVPVWLAQAFEHAETQDAAELLSVSIAAEQCAGLLGEGIDHLHLYTLNNPDLPYQVCRAIGIEPRPMRIAAAGGCG
ncbi:MAG: methylenetetrahydrofolate reductase [NAD(P)H] [Rhodobacteraceae bacterium]|nr:MAG: methylenetetrahydrofolate reductase [NAD(P)H] [Paracoccaceae bacterium]